MPILSQAFQMTISLRLGLAAAALACSTAASLAADLVLETTAPSPVAVATAGSVYVSGFGGGAIVNDVDYTASDGAFGQTFFDTGYNLDAALGYDFGNGLSIEAQVGYLSAAQTGASYNSLFYTGPVPVTGTGSVLYGMLNAWYGVEIGAITPFIGGGFGIASATLDSTYTGSLFEASTFEDNAVTYAWQVGGGVSLALTDSIDLVGRYRYFATGDFDVVDGQGTTLTSSFGIHLIDAGLKVKF